MESGDLCRNTAVRKWLLLQWSWKVLKLKTLREYEMHESAEPVFILLPQTWCGLEKVTWLFFACSTAKLMLESTSKIYNISIYFLPRRMVLYTQCPLFASSLQAKKIVKKSADLVMAFCKLLLESPISQLSSAHQTSKVMFRRRQRYTCFHDLT